MAPSKNDREARIARERLRAYQARQAVHERGKKRRRRDNWIAGIAVVVVAAAAVALQLTYFGVGPGAPKAKSTSAPSSSASPTPSPTTSGSVPSKSIAKNRTWTGTLTLNKNVKLGVKLDGKAAPQAVSSTISLVQSGFYIGTVCHRLTNADTFKVLQCGGAKTVADGPTGGPGYSYGPIENAPKTISGSKTDSNPYGSAKYKAGTIAMARSSGDANSMGSQFFIVYGDTTIPNDAAGGYTVIGTVTSGLDQLVSKIADKGLTPSDSSTPNDGTPKVATKITAFTLK
ncbi:peptidylprolyl isomerase [Gryllotalpicola ginsengisoli]|uniref:peptidylprolyl isomerase n=1 Tax=Gryllotalpicola ginsengisoli TaxID=444608 RepID=UPI0003B2F973|nr:peptidylprolyl isomerase [Gryllotalpicola ginsengisoli]